MLDKLVWITSVSNDFLLFSAAKPVTAMMGATESTIIVKISLLRMLRRNGFVKKLYIFISPLMACLQEKDSFADIKETPRRSEGVNVPKQSY